MKEKLIKLFEKLKKSKITWVVLAVILVAILALVIKKTVVDNPAVLNSEEKLIKEELDCTNEEAIKIREQIKEVFTTKIKSVELCEDYLKFNDEGDSVYKVYLDTESDGTLSVDVVTYEGSEELTEKERAKYSEDGPTVTIVDGVVVEETTGSNNKETEQEIENTELDDNQTIEDTEIADETEIIEDTEANITEDDSTKVEDDTVENIDNTDESEVNTITE